MSNETVTTPQSEAVTPSVTSWRTVDIVVASSIAAAFGVIFWAWGQLWNTAQPAFTGFPPAQGFMYGVWLLPGVLGAMIIRKPGAAIYTELVASIISAFLGTAWGLQVVLYGLVEGAALAHEPHRLAFYLYDLASSFHAHWNRGTENPDLRFVKVTNPQSTHARLGLVQAVSDVLTSGLTLIGADAPKEMR